MSILCSQYRSCDHTLGSIFFQSWTFSRLHAWSLFNEHDKGLNLLGIVTWPALGIQNRQAKKVYCGQCFPTVLAVNLPHDPLCITDWSNSIIMRACEFLPRLEPAESHRITWFDCARFIGKLHRDGYFSSVKWKFRYFDEPRNIAFCYARPRSVWLVEQSP